MRLYSDLIVSEPCEKEDKMTIQEKMRITNSNKQRRNFEESYKKAMAEIAYQEWQLEQKKIENRNALIITALFIVFMLSLKFIF